MLDESRLLFASHAYGLSVKIVEVPTGRHLRELVPLWWVPWFVGLSLGAYLISVTGWMRASAAEGGWAWLDLALVSGFALLIFSIRLYSGATFDTERSPHRFINGISLAGLTLTVTWLVLGKSQLILRALPLLLTLSCIIAVRYAVWGDRPVQVWRNTMWILVPTLYALLICLAAKLLRIEFLRRFPTDVATSHITVKTSMEKTFQLRHLLLAISCIAVLLVPLRPLIPVKRT